MIRRAKGKSGFRGVKIAKPELAPYGLRDDEPAAKGAACPTGTGRFRVGVCQKPARPGPQMVNDNSVCALMRRVETADRESFYVLHLNAGNRVIGIEEVAKGGLDFVMTTPREAFKSAILQNAAAVILAHNHPSGSPDPSEADYTMTQDMAKAGKLLGIPVRDHVVVGSDGQCVSLRTQNRRHVEWGDADPPRRRSRKRRSP